MAIRSRNRTVLTLAVVMTTGLVSLVAAAQPQADKTPATRENFTVAGHKAFVILPSAARTDKPMRWVWYAPTLGRKYPGGAETWMFDRFGRAGVAIAGIDVGESYGSPKGRAAYQALYEELTGKRGFHGKPVLLARSRGGLMLYNWAVEHPQSVGGIAGIYPVCNLASYPGVKRAAGAYEMTARELEAKLTEHNPIDRLAPLAKAKVPIFHIHGDRDKTVPLESNSAELAKRYAALGGPVEIEVIKGQGHNLWSGWFQSQALTDFVIARALGRSLAAPGKPATKPARKNVELPGLVVNFQKRCVDIEASICLEEGLLELIACTKGTKQHESIVAVTARPMHIHAALLLLGATNGNPAMSRPADEQKTRWVHLPPRGDPVDVYLVFKDKSGRMVERPISDFVALSERGPDEKHKAGGNDAAEDTRFPHTFLFAGSQLHDSGPGPRKYLADLSGNVISISTFGDELLCLPGIHAKADDALAWQIDATHLPKVGSKVTLRLRPQGKPASKTGKAVAED